MLDDEARIEEQAISRAAEVGLSSKLEQAEAIAVDVKTDLFKIVQGQADSVAIAGEGVVLQKDIRVQHLELSTDKIDINPFSALLGQVELNQPIQANARLVMTQEDLNRALNSDYVLNQAQFDLDVDGENVNLQMQQMQLTLPGGNKMVFDGKAVLREKGTTRQLAFYATVRPRTQTKAVMLEGFTCTEGDGISLEFTAALIQKVKELVNSAYIDLDTMALRISNMEVQQGKILLQAQAFVRELPTME
ncbi:DUF2993 domain-containing protein [Gloeocapsopsis dulcis]|uniref:DUF2993 domain-containing protein n=1 Tax=Gloeocapsopsis dulcis AAB1 = 1H9 TaxID=1433147 RepID=A0A6N8FQB6_9CHRO|nr:DUF2993 domain-containing protein [Gloeocapsopsis dulcis]MUL35403.1 hypothetical protein [Gloeocapsopsis dulcis AAB1 = 1H9]WNN90399.1 DUF2993 domain-containing protein [Gloeocapsopsis dulcis]